MGRLEYAYAGTRSAFGHYAFSLFPLSLILYIRDFLFSPFHTAVSLTSGGNGYVAMYMMYNKHPWLSMV